jgi:hypothetical protein
LLYVLAYLVLRFAVYLTIGVWGLKDSVVRRTWWLVPVRDAASFAVWVVSFFSNRISWRGLEFRVKNGLLTPVGSRSQTAYSVGSARANTALRLEPAATSHRDGGFRENARIGAVNKSPVSDRVNPRFPHT